MEYSDVLVYASNPWLNAVDGAIKNLKITPAGNKVASFKGVM